jgi:hypothetical protein
VGRPLGCGGPVVQIGWRKVLVGMRLCSWIVSSWFSSSVHTKKCSMIGRLSIKVISNRRDSGTSFNVEDRPCSIRTKSNTAPRGSSVNFLYSRCLRRCLAAQPPSLSPTDHEVLRTCCRCPLSFLVSPHPTSRHVTHSPVPPSRSLLPHLTLRFPSSCLTPNRFSRIGPSLRLDNLHAHRRPQRTSGTQRPSSVQ